MDSTSRLAHLLSILESGAFDTFIDEVEDAVLECKAAPYHLDDEPRQFELAKDVAAFANADGGVIVIGLETTKVLERAADMVKAVRPLPRDRFDGKRYRALIEAHVYPRIEGLRLDWHPSAVEPDVGVASLLVPRQSELQKPFLVNRVLGSDGKVRGTALAYFERHRDGVDRKEAKDFHYLIRAGRAMNGVDNRVAALEARLEASTRVATSPSARTTVATPPPDALERIDEEAEAAVPMRFPAVPNIEERIGEAVELVGLADRPAYILSARPIAPVLIPQLFATQRSPVRQLLESPPELRHGGFDIDAGNTAVIVEGKLRRALHAETNRDLELWRDATLLFVAPADNNFLCWTNKPVPPLVINPIALLESIYLFCTLAQSIQQHTDPPNCGVRLCVELRGMEGAHRLSLSPGAVGSMGWDFRTERYPAPKPSACFQETWARGQINPGILTVAVAKKIYEWFGLTHDRIPYTVGDGDGLRFDPELLKR